MLKLLTHKLRTHSINEDHYVEKADEDHDSGTESDEEIEATEPQSTASDRMCSVSPADTGCSMSSPQPDNQHDPHSSEEELEVINGRNGRQTPAGRPLRAASACLAEKRKWSQVAEGQSRRFTPENEENMSHYGNLSPSSPCSPYLKCYGEENVHPLEHSGSSDDEVHNLLTPTAAPVRFRTSPPLEAVKPERRTVTSCPGGPKGGTASPPSKLAHYEISSLSPRKRSRHSRHASAQQRPYLDFEKMQQEDNKCNIPPSAPKRIENAINECQEEIKVAILSEALEALNVKEHARSRIKRSSFSSDEKRIAGCLLQCVYRKMKAVNERGFPTLAGLVNLYTDGIKQRGYIRATVDAVNICLRRADRKHLTSLKSLEERGKTCDIAYDVFDCVSEEIGNYCGQSP